MSLNIIDQYIESKRHKWSETSLKTERARLNNIDLTKSPKDLMDCFTGKSLYSAKTLMIRLSDLHDFMVKSGLTGKPNQYKEFLDNNYRFKNAYKKQELDVTKADAALRISRLKNPQVVEWAQYLLNTGIRLSEMDTVSPNGQYWEVTGKQGKSRKVYLAPPASRPPYKYTLQRELSKVGLTPKMLRKLFASSLDQNKVGLKDLMKIMGWSSVQTADSYLQSSNDSKLQEIVNGN